MNSKRRLEMAGSGGKIEALTVLDAPSNASNRHAELSSEGLVPFYQTPANDPASRASAHGVGDVYTSDDLALLESFAHLQRAIDVLDRAGHRELVLALLDAANAILHARKAA